MRETQRRFVMIDGDNKWKRNCLSHYAISAVMRGDYTYAGMTYANMVELQAISDKIREI